jgi:hypothetical protein
MSPKASTTLLDATLPPLRDAALVPISLRLPKGSLPCHRVQWSQTDVLVFFCDVADVGEHLKRSPHELGVLSDTEIQNWRRFRFERDRDLYAVAQLVGRNSVAYSAIFARGGVVRRNAVAPYGPTDLRLLSRSNL